MTSRPARGFVRWIGGDHRSQDLAVFRTTGLNLFASIFAVIAVVLGFAALVKFPRSVSTHMVVPLVCTAMAMLVWVGSVLSAVRVRADALVADNLLVRHVIPWERLAGVFVEPGQGMVARLDDGAVVGCSAYGRSLADAMEGYQGQRQVLERIRDASRQARLTHDQISPAPPYRRQLNVPWRPLLAFLAAFEAVSWIVFAVH